VLLVILVVFIGLRWKFLQVPFERDEGEYAYIAQRMLSGEYPFQSAYSLKLPGTAMMNALFFIAFGQSVFAVHFGLLLVDLGALIAMYFFAQRFFDKSYALVTSAVLAAFLLSRSTLGFAAHNEHFVILFVLLGALLLLRHSTDASPPRSMRLLLAGLCFGLAVLMKQHAYWFILWAIIASYFLLTGWKQRVKSAALISIGASIPLAGFALSVIHVGENSAAYFWLVDYARSYLHILKWREAIVVLIVSSRVILLDTFFILCIAVIGLAVLVRKFRSNLQARIVLLFGVAGFCSFAQGFYFRDHYFIMFAPAVCLMVAYGAQYVVSLIRPRHTPRVSVALVVIGASIILAQYFTVQHGYFFSWDGRTLLHQVYRNQQFDVYPQVAAYIAENTRVSDAVAVIGSEPQTYFYSRRRAATKYLYLYPLLEPQAFRGRMTQEFTREVEAGNPTLLLVVRTPSQFSENPIFASWLEQYINSSFTLDKQYVFSSINEPGDSGRVLSIDLYKRTPNVPGSKRLSL